jgi:hypothetical protein
MFGLCLEMGSVWGGYFLCVVTIGQLWMFEWANGYTVCLEKVSPIFKIPAHHRDLIFQSNEGMTPVLIKLSQLIAITKMII